MNFLNELLIPADQAIAIDSAAGALQVSEAGRTVSVRDASGTSYRFPASVAFALGSALISKSLRGLYERLATSDRVEFVLTGQFQGGREMIEYELRDLGYTITNRVSADSIVICGELPEGGTTKSRYAADLGAVTINEAEATALTMIVGMEQLLAAERSS